MTVIFFLQKPYIIKQCKGNKDEYSCIMCGIVGSLVLYVDEM